MVEKYMAQVSTKNGLFSRNKAGKELLIGS